MFHIPVNSAGQRSQLQVSYILNGINVVKELELSFFDQFFVHTGVLGMLAGVLACTVESISYYPTVAQMCDAPPPPLHAINRGIGIEGFGTVLAGLWGSGNGTNTFGENVGAIGVTKVCSCII